MKNSVLAATRRGQAIFPMPDKNFCPEGPDISFFIFVSIMWRNHWRVFASSFKRRHLTKMKYLLFTLILSSALHAQSSFTTLEDLAVYDDNNDGYARFDLTLNSSLLLDGLDPETNKVSYHLTFNDADFNRNPVRKPKSYANTIQYSQELYARVTNTEDPSNYSVDLFTIRTHSSRTIEAEANLKQ